MPNDEAFILNPENWVELYSDTLFNYAYYRVNDRETALDLVQDTFIAALKGADSFRGQSSEKTWLIAILKRKTIDYYRKAFRKHETSLNEHIAGDDAYDSPFSSDDDTRGQWTKSRQPAEWGGNVEKKIEGEEFNQVLEDCMGHLPQKQAAVFKLQQIDEVKSDEICKELEITTSNLWVLVHRARLQLRECIEKNWLNQ